MSPLPALGQLVTDRSAVVVTADLAGADLLGYPDPAALVGTDVTAHLDGEVAAAVGELLETAPPGVHRLPRRAIERRDGRRLRADLRLVLPFGGGGGREQEVRWLLQPIEPAGSTGGGDATGFADVPCLLYVVDADWQLEAVAGAAREVTGYPPELWSGDLWRQRVHPEDRPAMLAARERCVALGDTLELDYRLYRRDGRPHWLRDRAKVVAEGPTRIEGMLLDVTAQRRTEEELSDAVAAARDDVVRLQRADEAKTAFLRVFVHDVRSPLANASGLLDRLLEHPGGDARATLEAIADSLSRTQALVGEVLDLERLRGARVGTDVQVLDLERFLLEARDELHVGAERVAVEGVGVTALPDPALLRRAVVNLLRNAIVHAGYGTAIVARGWREGATTMLVVDDDGRGVPDEVKSSIFEPFVRNSGPEQPGVGLGLALVAQIVALYEGESWVEDRPGGGASFRIRVPDPAPLRDAGGRV